MRRTSCGIWYAASIERLEKESGGYGRRTPDYVVCAASICGVVAGWFTRSVYSKSGVDR